MKNQSPELGNYYYQAVSPLLSTPLQKRAAAYYQYPNLLINHYGFSPQDAPIFARSELIHSLADKGPGYFGVRINAKTNRPVSAAWIPEENSSCGGYQRTPQQWLHMAIADCRPDNNGHYSIPDHHLTRWALRHGAKLPQDVSPLIRKRFPMLFPE